MPSTGELLAESRKNIGLTQEKAAERLPMSLRKLQDLENDNVNASQEDLAAIVEAYGDKRLAFKLAQKCPVWQIVLPNLDDKTLSAAACGLLKSMRRLADKEIEILDIAENNMIDEHEQQNEDDIKRLVVMLAKACMEYLQADGRFDGELLK